MKVKGNFSPIERFLTLGFFLLLLSIVLFLFFHARVMEFGVKRDFSSIQLQDLAVFKERLKKHDSLNFATWEDRTYSRFEIIDERQKYISQVKYLDWSQDAAKWLGWRIYNVNREFKIIPYKLTFGRDGYYETMARRKAWKENKNKNREL